MNIGLIALALLFLFLLYKMMPARGVQHIHAKELEKWLKNEKNVQWLDVRTPGEYKSGHIRQFKNIPLQVLNAKADKLDPKKKTIIICRSGNRSNTACKMLKKKGFEDVYNVRGGIIQYPGRTVQK
ncbi:MAG TPA: rhodanese-like domain-containing protein [Massilibacterium sp.]|nr:rhodanese-like domain-containing protein [Massilibacterium sp.]